MLLTAGLPLIGSNESGKASPSLVVAAWAPVEVIGAAEDRLSYPGSTHTQRKREGLHSIASVFHHPATAHS